MNIDKRAVVGPERLKVTGYGELTSRNIGCEPKHYKHYHLTYKYRLLTRRRDHERLNTLLESQRQLYNSALQERIGAYKIAKKSVSFYDQCKSLTECRQEFNEMKKVPVNLQRGTLKRLDNAYKGFFRRIKVKGEKAGFPRFKGWGRFNTLEWAEFGGMTFNGQRIKSKAFGSIKVYLHRPLPEVYSIKTVKLVRDLKGWHVCFALQVPDVPKIPVNSQIGVDVGLTSLITLSNGEKISNIRPSLKHERKLRLTNRALARCKKGSNRRKKVKRALQSVHAKIKNTRQTYLNQVSSKLVKDYDLIALEKLNIKKMVQSRLAKSINDVSWGQLANMITYKAEKAGKSVIFVDPKYTSQDW